MESVSSGEQEKWLLGDYLVQLCGKMCLKKVSVTQLHAFGIASD
jgi:hypothetical protein